jgi:hypothetical protein
MEGLKAFIIGWMLSKLQGVFKQLQMDEFLVHDVQNCLMILFYF